MSSLKQIQYLHIEPSEKGTHTNKCMTFFLKEEEERNCSKIIRYFGKLLILSKNLEMTHIAGGGGIIRVIITQCARKSIGLFL